MKSIIVFKVLLISTTFAFAQPGVRMSDEQRECLRKEIGEPHREQRPDRDKMEKAFKTCKVELPAPPKPGDRKEMDDEFVSRIEGHFEKADDEKKTRMREHLREIFQKTESEDLKAKIRKFLRKHPDTGSESVTPAVESSK